jgi:DNA replicative helicase MCM subunit Mcm2 (Cdc46/Mcm family)
MASSAQNPSEILALAVKHSLQTQEQRIFIDLCQFNSDNGCRGKGATHSTSSSSSSSSAPELIRTECDISVDYQLLATASPDIGNRIISRPRLIIPLVTAAITSLQQPSMRSGDVPLFTKCNPRLTKLSERRTFPCGEEVGTLVCLSGVIGALAPAKLVLTSGTYECMIAGCRRRQTDSIDHLECEFREINSPSACAKPRCKGKLFTRIKSNDRFTGYRKFTLLRDMRYGVRSDVQHGNRAITVIACGPLATSMYLTAGAHVIVTGIVDVEKHYMHDGDSMDYQLCLYANNIAPTNSSMSTGGVAKPLVVGNSECASCRSASDDPTWLFTILQRTCPELYAMWQAKFAIMLALVCQQLDNGITSSNTATTTTSSSSTTSSTTSSTDPNPTPPNLLLTTTQRMTPHVLLCGDHGTGKSTLLAFANRIAHLSVAISASCTTAAGLTFAKSSNPDYEVEPGALVIASGGICCVDDINFFSKDILESLKDAMESQKIVGTYANGQFEMPTRCSLIAATHGNCTKGTMSTPFESRLDIIMPLAANNDDVDFQRCVATRQLAFMTPGNVGSSTPASGNYMQFLRTMLAEATSLPTPTLTASARQILKAYFDDPRTASSRTVTNRFMETLVRLAMASARLMLRRMVTLFDAIMVVHIMMQTSMPLPVSLTVFPENPVEWYAEIKAGVLAYLRLRISSPSKQTTTIEPHKADHH